MHALLFVLHVGVLWEYESDDNAGVGSGGGVVAVSACMGGTRCSGVLPSTGDVLEMSVVRGVWHVYVFGSGGVGGEGGEWMRETILVWNWWMFIII